MSIARERKKTCYIVNINNITYKLAKLKWYLHNNIHNNNN